MTKKASVIDREIVNSVRAKSASIVSERQVAGIVVRALCDSYADPRAVPLDDVKELIVHAIAAYRHEVASHEDVAV